VVVLPWHNPVLLAEQAATIDLMSNGRLEFGVGKGYRHNEFASFCIPMAEADERFEEGLALVVKSWTSEQRFSHHGKYWHFENIVVEPPTAQKPHPPIWMAAGKPDSIRAVAERGFGLMLDQFAVPEAIIERFDLFKAEVEKRGRTFDPMTVAVARAFYVARDAADKASAVERRLAATRRMTSLAQSPAGDNKSSMVSFADTREASEQSALFGTPDEIAGKLEHLRRAGIARVLLNGPPSRDQLRRFARDVMPAFADPAKIRVAG
jgi:alkanesulfonate monooxygenase SsuD/methylene tetrahydromethanopterin reductase-like flavin-dependent oxidoreductase (luciferase family)